ncbi:MAG: hypothetical protein OXC95_11170 [Dehalococcoidia bacterium]|nr:hypothetical protein [Dehalococcoidia bacterium]
MMAEARSLNWVAQEMANALNRHNIDPSQGYVVPLGYILSSVVLQALAAETALKALQMAKLRYFIHGHDLITLFKKLQPDMRYGINFIYQSLAQDLNTERPDLINLDMSVEDVFRRHRRDFEEWRYVYELGEGTNVNLLDLRLATKAMILVYDAVTFDPSVHDPNKTFG